MKHFIKKIIFLFFGFLFIFVPLLLLFVYYVGAVSSNYKIDPTITTLYMGDSYIECAINDSLLPSSINIAASSESYYYSYYKLKKLIINNPSISQVYLGFSFHSLSSHNDQSLNSKFIVPRYFSLLPNKEKLRILYYNKNQILSIIKNIIKEGVIIIKDKKKAPYYGGFKNDFFQTAPAKQSVDKSVSFHYYTYGEVNPFSTLNIHYLNKINDLCKSNSIDLFLLNTPLYSYYYNNVPDEYITQLSNIINQYNFKYIDLSILDLGEKCFSPDGCHVSNFGAQITSTELFKMKTPHNTQ